MTNTKKNKKPLNGSLLTHDPVLKFISLFFLVVLAFAALVGIISLIIWLLSFVGLGLDIATTGIENKTGVNIWQYLIPLAIYGIIALLYYFVGKYLYKYKQYTTCKIGLVLLSLGVIILAYNTYLSLTLTHNGMDAKFVLHISNGRALFNLDNPVGVIAVHILVFLLPGLIMAATQIPENNYD
jgi:hypothetical protein